MNYGDHYSLQGENKSTAVEETVEKTVTAARLFYGSTNPGKAGNNSREAGDIDDVIAEEREAIMNFASNAWDAIHQGGVAFRTAIVQFFSDIIKFFKDLGTEIGKSISSVFENLSKTAKNLVGRNSKLEKDKDRTIEALDLAGHEKTKILDKVGEEFVRVKDDLKGAFERGTFRQEESKKSTVHSPMKNNKGSKSI